MQRQLVGVNASVTAKWGSELRGGTLIGPNQRGGERGALHHRRPTVNLRADERAVGGGDIVANAAAAAAAAPMHRPQVPHWGGFGARGTGILVHDASVRVRGKDPQKWATLQRWRARDLGWEKRELKFRARAHSHQCIVCAPARATTSARDFPSPCAPLLDARASALLADRRAHEAAD